MPTRTLTRLTGSLVIACSAVLVSACGWDGQFNIGGYTTQPLHDPTIRTVYVPMFENITFRRGLEQDITRAVVREIESKGYMKVDSCRETADTELIGRLVARRKGLINSNQLNEIREAEVGMVVELVWRDLRPGRTGDLLSQQKKKDFDPLAPPDLQQQRPMIVTPTGTFIPEVGGSVTTAEQQAVKRLAIQIVSMMEQPW